MLRMQTVDFDAVRPEWSEFCRLVSEEKNHVRARTCLQLPVKALAPL